MNVKKKNPDHKRKKVWVIIYKLYIPTAEKGLAFSIFDIRVWGPVLSCLKMIGIANISSPFSFLKSSPPPSLLLYLAPFCCYVPLPILQFRVKTGIMQEVMGCGSKMEEIRMLLDSHPFLLRSRAKQFQRKCRYARLWSCDARGWKYVGSSQSFLHR